MLDPFTEKEKDTFGTLPYIYIFYIRRLWRDKDRWSSRGFPMILMVKWALETRLYKCWFKELLKCSPYENDMGKIAVTAIHSSDTDIHTYIDLTHFLELFQSKRLNRLLYWDFRLWITWFPRWQLFVLSVLSWSQRNATNNYYAHTLMLYILVCAYMNYKNHEKVIQASNPPWNPVTNLLQQL